MIAAGSNLRLGLAIALGLALTLALGYSLDGSGHRRSQTTGAVTTTFDLDLLAGNATILYDGVAKYLPGAAGAGSEAGGAWRTALTDLSGSPILFVDTAGVTSGLVHYDPYGVPRPGSSAAVGIGYAGEYRDATGLVNLRARSHDPVLGRFIGRDTFAGVGSAPQTGNRYAYAVANPLRFSDPSGHFVQTLIEHPATVLEIALTFTPSGPPSSSATPSSPAPTRPPASTSTPRSPAWPSWRSPPSRSCASWARASAP